MRVIGVAVVAACFLAIIYAAFDLRRDHSQTKRIRDECRRTHSDAGEVKTCITEMTLLRARDPEMP
jgi:hypothetical protein